MELIKVVMLVSAFVHFSMALSIESVQKGMLYYILQKIGKTL